jgi:hypothetical protein
MEIVMDMKFKRPSNFEAVDTAFHIADRPVFFAYGDVILERATITISAFRHVSTVRLQILQKATPPRQISNDQAASRKGWL